MRKSGFQAPGAAVPTRRKGRGAGSNPASRFLRVHSVVESDDWEGTAAEIAADVHTDVATELYPDRTRNLITRNRSPDIPFDRSINPYKGCEHGCVYCFARPTHAYLDLSPGIDFETRIFYKTGVREALVAELSRPGYRCRAIAMGTNTDPYQPAEREQRVTRSVLEVLLEHRHPVSIVTKGQLILRDLDLLGALAERQLVHVAVSVTTLDSGLKTRLEPRAAGPAARLRMIQALSAAGVPTGVMVAPVIPFLNDHEIESILAAAAEAGAREANYVLLRLPLEVRPLFEEWLAQHCPLKAGRIMKAVHECHGGKAYDAAWGRRMRGTGVYADLIERRFAAAARKQGLDSHAGSGSRGAGHDSEKVESGHRLRTDLFRAPGHEQLDLF